MAGLGEGGVYACWLAVNGGVYTGFCLTRGDESHPPPLKTLRSFFAAGLSTALGSSLMNFTDVSKVRMQTESRVTGKPAVMYTSFSQTARRIVAEEGLWGLWKPGLTATATRDVIYSGIRVGLYPVLRQLMAGEDGSDIGIAKKLLIGATTGAIGSAIANPMDLVMIRSMAEAGATKDGILTTGLKAGQAKAYNNSFDCFLKVIRQESFLTLYRGMSMTMARASTGTAAHLATYDEVKRQTIAAGIAQEGALLHAGAGVAAAFAFVTAAAPFDIMKSRIMAADVPTSVWTMVSTSFKQEGPLVFYRGWVPSFARVGPLYIIINPLMEQMRLMMGLGYF